MNPVPNVGNAEFYPLMQQQMEHQEALDFTNDSENYKKKRAKKDGENKRRESKFNPNYTPDYGSNYLHTANPVEMQFTKDKNGNLIIKSVGSDNK